MITEKTDFVGEYKVSKTCYDALQLYIDKFEPYYLKRLMGADLYALFNADLAGSPSVPVSAIYLSLFNPFDIDDNGCLRSSEGIKQMLIEFIYFHYVRDSAHKKTQGGTVVNDVEVSNPSPYNGYNLVQAYNEGVKNYKEIQWFIIDNESDYPDENIQPLEYISGI